MAVMRHSSGMRNGSSINDRSLMVSGDGVRMNFYFYRRRIRQKWFMRWVSVK